MCCKIPSAKNLYPHILLYLDCFNIKTSKQIHCMQASISKRLYIDVVIIVCTGIVGKDQWCCNAIHVCKQQFCILTPFSIKTAMTLQYSVPFPLVSKVRD